MKILFFTTAPFNMGGPGKWFINLFSELVKRGHEVGVITWGNQGSLMYHCKNIKIIYDRPIIDLFGFRSLNFLSSIIRAALIMRKEFKFEIIQTGGIFESFGTVFGSMKVPVITTLHGDYYTELIPFLQNTPYPRIFKTIYYIMEKIAIKRTSIFTSPSKWLIERLRERINPNRICVIPNAIHLPNLREINEARDKLGLPKNKKIFVSITNFNSEKRYLALKMLMDSIKQMNNINQIQIIIIGGRNPHGKEEWIKKIKEYAMSLPIFFIGYKKDILDYLFAADVVLHPSFLDNHPISILEAMGCGKPVFASKVGGIPEIIDNEYNGFLLENDSKEWAAILDRTVKEELNLIDIGLKAREKIENNFSWSLIIEKYEKIYQSLKI